MLDAAVTLPTHMNAAVYQEARRLSVEAWPVPEPGPGEVVLEVSHCGVCGTDLHMLMEGILPTDLLIEPDDVPLGGLQAAMQRLVAGEIGGTVLVAPQR